MIFPDLETWNMVNGKTIETPLSGFHVKNGKDVGVEMFRVFWMRPQENLPFYGNDARECGEYTAGPGSGRHDHGACFITTQVGGYACTSLRQFAVEYTLTSMDFGTKGEGTVDMRHHTSLRH